MAMEKMFLEYQTRPSFGSADAILLSERVWGVGCGGGSSAIAMPPIHFLFTSRVV
jgi:hypothetical protein